MVTGMALPVICSQQLRRQNASDTMMPPPIFVHGAVDMA
jgi:hypothetical protein